MRYHVDVVRIRENSIQLNGWAIGKTPETKIRFRVTDGKGTPVSFQYLLLECGIIGVPLITWVVASFGITSIMSGERRISWRSWAKEEGSASGSTRS